MKYKVLKSLYVESAGRVLRPGEPVELDERQGEVLAHKGVVAPADAPRKPRRGDDPENDKLQDI